jgi:NACHT domain/Phage integrase family
MIEAKSRSDTVGINEVTPFTNTADALLRAGIIQSSIFVTNTKFSQDAKSSIIGKAGIRLSTLHDLEQDLFNYSESLLKIIHDYESSPIFQDYIELEGEREERGTRTIVPDVASYILDWSKKNRSLLVLCGDFGSGKTTALERVHHQQAKLRLTEHNALLPLSFRLRSFLQYPDLWTFVSTSLRDNNHISPTRQVFEKQLAAGNFLVLLDGFDEIETGANAVARAAHLKRLTALISAKSPCVLATRPTYFDSFEDMSRSLVNSLEKTPEFTGLESIRQDMPRLLNRLNIGHSQSFRSDTLRNVVTISQLSEEKITEYLEKHKVELHKKTRLSTDAIKKFLFRIYDLEDLMSRPLLLKMVVVTILEGMVKVSQTKSIGPSTLYRLYTQLCATRDIDNRPKQFLSSDERLLACCEIALVMLREKKIVLNAREVVLAISRTNLPSVGAFRASEQSMALERAFADIRVCSFLSFGDDGSLRFAHKSYSEFFVAQSLVTNRSGAAGYWLAEFNAFAEYSMGREIIYFLGSFARDTPLFGTFIQTALRRGHGVRPRTKDLIRRIAFASGSLLDRMSFAGGLVEAVDLRKVSVSKAFMRNVNFSNVTIRDLQASSWQLRKCNFRDTSISHSKFDDCAIDLDLRDSEFDTCEFQGGTVGFGGSGWSLRETTIWNAPSRFDGHGRLQKVRWDRKLIKRHFVEFNGEAVASVKTGFRRAASLAGLSGKVTPHTLRHTAATWLMQSGTDRWQAAGYLGMSVEMLEKVYGHHHPDYLQAAVAAIGNGSRTKQEQRKTVSVGIAVGPQEIRKPNR